jgi:arylsulfatase A-like enzyme
VIASDMLTLPQLFARHGYATMVIGKWHLGLGTSGTKVDWNGDVAPGPCEVGFEHCFLLPSTNDRVPCVYLADRRVAGLHPNDPLHVGAAPAGFTGTVYPDGKRHPEAMTYYASSHGHDDSVIAGIGRIGFQWGGSNALWNDETMTDVFVAEARKYLAAQRPGKPFFLFFSSQCIHCPRTPHPRFRGSSGLSYRGDAMVEFDQATGALLAALDEFGFARDTIVIFTSDNGPVYDDGYADGTTVPTSTQEQDRGHDASGPWRGGKYQIYEGGTRVPFVVRWPGHVEPGVSAATVSQIDLIASFARLLGGELAADQAIDSRDTLDALLGKDPKGLPFLIEEAGRLALRVGTWKYVQPRGKQGKDELYDLGADPGERHDRAGDDPAKVAELRQQLERLVAGRGLRAHR